MSRTKKHARDSRIATVATEKKLIATSRTRNMFMTKNTTMPLSRGNKVQRILQEGVQQVQYENRNKQGDRLLLVKPSISPFYQCRTPRSSSGTEYQHKADDSAYGRPPGRDYVDGMPPWKS